MAKFKGEEILAALGLSETKGPLLDVMRVATDSRKVMPGDLYVVLKGENFDGHDFLDQAVKSGASGVVISNDSDWENLDVSIYRVESPLVALGQLASFHRRRFSIPIIGITGSVGKTSTKDLIAAALGSESEVLKTQGNFNNEIGLPLTLLELNENHRYGVVEMGMRGLGEIAYLAQIAQPTIGVVTNVEEVHIELLGTKEAVAQAKGELIEFLQEKDSLGVLNLDDPYVAKMKEKAGGKILTYGTSDLADIHGEVICHDREGLKIRYQYLQEATQDIFLPLYGAHQLSNALAAIGIARHLGRTPEKIQEGLKRLKSSPMRMEPKTVQGIFVLNDAYNANVRAMKAALDTFKQIGTGKRVVFLGDMKELGERAFDSHQEVIRYALESNVDQLILTGEEMKKASEVISSDRMIHSNQPEELVDILQKNLQEGDSLLVKASRGMKLEELLKQWEHSFESSQKK